MVPCIRLFGQTQHNAFEKALNMNSLALGNDDVKPEAKRENHTSAFSCCLHKQSAKIDSQLYWHREIENVASKAHN